MYIARWCRRESRDWIRWNRIGRWLRQQSAIHSSFVDFCRSHGVVEHQYVVLSPAGRVLKPTDAPLSWCCSSLLLLQLLLMMTTMVLGQLFLKYHGCGGAQQTPSCILPSGERRATQTSFGGKSRDDRRCDVVPTHYSLDKIVIKQLFWVIQVTFRSSEMECVIKSYTGLYLFTFKIADKINLPKCV